MVQGYSQQESPCVMLVCYSLNNNLSQHFRVCTGCIDFGFSSAYCMTPREFPRALASLPLQVSLLLSLLVGALWSVLSIIMMIYKGMLVPVSYVQQFGLATESYGLRDVLALWLPNFLTLVCR